MSADGVSWPLSQGVRLSTETLSALAKPSAPPQFLRARFNVRFCEDSMGISAVYRRAGACSVCYRTERFPPRERSCHAGSSFRFSAAVGEGAEVRRADLGGVLLQGPRKPRTFRRPG